MDPSYWELVPTTSRKLFHSRYYFPLSLSQLSLFFWPFLELQLVCFSLRFDWREGRFTFEWLYLFIGSKVLYWLHLLEQWECFYSKLNLLQPIQYLLKIYYQSLKCQWKLFIQIQFRSNAHDSKNRCKNQYLLLYVP